MLGLFKWRNKHLERFRHMPEVTELVNSKNKNTITAHCRSRELCFLTVIAGDEI